MTEDLLNTMIDLQTRLAYQEDGLQHLSDQLARQAEDLRYAQRQIQLLNQKLQDIQQATEDPSAVSNERPPHY